MRLELISSLERILCFCHTGNTAVFATSLMHPLGLSKGALKDGFPMLLPLFEQPTIALARGHGFAIDARKWPLKEGYPAVASKRAQILTYSVRHFLVSHHLIDVVPHGIITIIIHGELLGAKVVLYNHPHYMWGLWHLIEPPYNGDDYMRGLWHLVKPTYSKDDYTRGLWYPIKPRI